MTRVRESGEMECVFVDGGRDDGVDVAGERHLYRGFHRVAGDAPGPHDAIAVTIRIAAPETPQAYRSSSLRRQPSDLIFRSYDYNLSIDRLGQSPGRDLGADAAWIPQRHRKPRSLRVPVRLSRRFATLRASFSRPLRPLRPLPQDLIST